MPLPVEPLQALVDDLSGRGSQVGECVLQRQGAAQGDDNRLLVPIYNHAERNLLQLVPDNIEMSHLDHSEKIMLFDKPVGEVYDIFSTNLEDSPHG